MYGREVLRAADSKVQWAVANDAKSVAGAHAIPLKPDAEEETALDLIEESDAEIAYPIVCVNKKDGSIRLCVDYRALNAVTVSDDFPMEEAVDLIQSMARRTSLPRWIY
ncbi:hypothetical protein AVEN_224494-1 [Araneus ventricosus]|uniref:Transposon Ty3-I Gag-Pol polyprotein n=1 Tax=Araneus ventricosus TaxID=182803 RepID=A0A4Y2L5N7_ARAVE|nr:hypothetical protein AVEN_224494-1 [Araneus ventricosus]